MFEFCFTDVKADINIPSVVVQMAREETGVRGVLLVHHISYLITFIAKKWIDYICEMLFIPSESMFLSVIVPVVEDRKVIAHSLASDKT